MFWFAHLIPTSSRDAVHLCRIFHTLDGVLMRSNRRVSAWVDIVHFQLTIDRSRRHMNRVLKYFEIKVEFMNETTTPQHSPGSRHQAPAHCGDTFVATRLPGHRKVAHFRPRTMRRGIEMLRVRRWHRISHRMADNWFVLRSSLPLFGFVSDWCCKIHKLIRVFPYYCFSWWIWKSVDFVYWRSMYLKSTMINFQILKFFLQAVKIEMIEIWFEYQLSVVIRSRDKQIVGYSDPSISRRVLCLLNYCRSVLYILYLSSFTII